MDYRLDLTAYRCPLPLLMAKKALKSLAQGDSLTVLLHAPTLSDFYLLAKDNNTDCRLISNENQIVILKFDKLPSFAEFPLK